MVRDFCRDEGEILKSFSPLSSREGCYSLTVPTGNCYSVSLVVACWQVPAHMFVSAVPACNCFSGCRSEWSSSTRPEPVLGLLRQQSASEGKASYVGHLTTPPLLSTLTTNAKIRVLFYYEGFYVELWEISRNYLSDVNTGGGGGGVPRPEPVCISGEIKTFFLHQLFRVYPACSHCWVLNSTDLKYRAEPRTIQLWGAERI